ncbi:uncharacterized protein I206_100329 [Kwoniella pini CBS 10737]|uniref:Uncharacterized protein n=1 Tax=Kwoniella pini CBS 10737 TaxID=1296096 RepID=A0A1B9IEI2_9TREE|nr:uncharacterized protein I206_00996 [Kwoniella pini CBS 10737]OCF53690.1 hypothetical protein I206_00996 [Kwoniella pini CBS 10737]
MGHYNHEGPHTPYLSIQTNTSFTSVISNTTSIKRVPEAWYEGKYYHDCFLVKRVATGGFCEPNDCLRGGGNDRGECQPGPGDRCLGIRLGPTAPRVYCRNCKCVGPGTKKVKINNKSKLKKTTKRAASHISRIGLRQSDAYFKQFDQWHDASHIAAPMADCTIISSGNTRVTLLRPIILPSSDVKRNVNRELVINNAIREVDEFGSVATASIEMLSRDINKRADWSSINFQYWSAYGARGLDADREEIVDIVLDLIRNGEEGMSGLCAAILDDGNAWATVKIWTGVDGNGLANCECSSVDAPELEQEVCGYANLSEHEGGWPDYVW